MILRRTRRLRDTRHAQRGGFTLIEILLATLIASLVLGAVYMLLSVTLQQTQMTRDAVEVEDLSRGVFNKFTIDLSGTLAPLPPKSGGNSAASGGAQAPSSTGMPSSGETPMGDGSSMPTGGTSGTPAPTSGTPDTSTPGATDNATAVAADYAFQGGVIGDEKKLVVYAGRVPEAFRRNGNPNDTRCDQRQIIYWLGKGSNGGLYRRERPWITADGVRNGIDDDEEATDSALLAEEVTDLTFEYFDGTSWTTSWDGTSPGPDGVTPLGPPRAIRVTLSLRIPISRSEPVVKQVSQVIAVRSAPGTYTPPLLEAPTDGGDNAVPADPATGGTTPQGGTTPGGTTTSGGATTPGKSPGGGAPSGNSSNKAPSAPSMPSGGNKGTTMPGGMGGGKGGR